MLLFCILLGNLIYDNITANGYNIGFSIIGIIFGVGFGFFSFIFFSFDDLTGIIGTTCCISFSICNLGFYSISFFEKDTVTILSQNFILRKYLYIKIYEIVKISYVPYQCITFVHLLKFISGITIFNGKLKYLVRPRLITL